MSGGERAAVQMPLLLPPKLEEEVTDVSTRFNLHLMLQV